MSIARRLARIALAVAVLTPIGVSASPYEVEACTADAECDDGSFCNGTETCQAGSCRPGAPPCPGSGCDEASETCRLGHDPRIEVGTVWAGSDRVTVALGTAFRRPVIVASAASDGLDVPAVTRVSNVFPTSFEVRLQNPSGVPVEPREVSYLVVEEGAWNVAGVAIEAHRVTATQTDRLGSWGGSPLAYRGRFRRPVVLGQVMTENDDRWSYFWAHFATNAGGKMTRGPARWNGLRIGKAVAEDPDTVREHEQLGVIVIEAGRGRIGGMSFEAGVTAPRVAGATDLPYHVHPFAAPFDRKPAGAIVALAGLMGGNGGWAQVVAGSLDAASVALFTDEDQLRDFERAHVGERVAYFAFDRAGSSARERPMPAAQVPGVPEPGGLADVHPACRPEPPMGPVLPAYDACIQSGIAACDQSLEACFAGTQSMISCGNAANAPCGAFSAAVGARLKAAGRLVSARKFKQVLGSIGTALNLDCLACLGDRYVEKSLCRVDARSFTARTQTDCECTSSPAPEPTCLNRYHLEVTVGGLGCNEFVTGTVRCDGREVRPLWITDDRPTVLVEGACRHTEDWSVELGPVEHWYASDDLRTCRLATANGQGIPQNGGVVPVTLDCSSSGPESRVPKRRLFARTRCVPEEAGFDLDVTVDECGSQRTVRYPWDHTDPNPFDLGIDAEAGAFLTMEVSTLPGTGLVCTTSPQFGHTPPGTSNLLVTTVTCAPPGAPEPGADCQGIDLEVELAGDIAERGGVTLDRDVGGEDKGSITLGLPGQQSVIDAEPDESFRFEVANRVVTLANGDKNFCRPMLVAGNAPTDGSSKFLTGTISCTTTPESERPEGIRPERNDGGEVDPFGWGRGPSGNPGNTCGNSRLICPPGITTEDNPEVCDPPEHCQDPQTGECLCTGITVTSDECYWEPSETICGVAEFVTTPGGNLVIRGDVDPRAPQLADQSLLVSGTGSDDRGLQGVVFGIDGVYAGHVDAGGLSSFAFDGVTLDTGDLTEGAHTLHMFVLDDEGFPSSIEMPFQVDHRANPCAGDTAPPAVSLTAPAHGSTIPAGPFTVTATASDAGSGVRAVRFFRGSERLHIDHSAPFTWTWTAEPGDHALRAVAVDHCGNSATATAVVTVTNACGTVSPPTAAIASPTHGGWLAPGDHTVAVDASASPGRTIDRVEIDVGQADTAIDASAPYAVTGSFDSRGIVEIVARAYDSCGQRANARATVFVGDAPSGCELDAHAPVVELDGPADGDAILPGPIAVAVEAIDDLVLRAGALEIDGSVPAGMTIASASSPYAFTWNATPGIHTLRGRALDVCGKVGYSLARTVTVSEDAGCSGDNTPPSVTFTSPTEGATVAGTIDLEAAASDAGSGVASVTFIADGTALGVDPAAPWRYEDWSPAPGPHTLTARAVDNCGNVAETSIAVDTPVSCTGVPAPSVAITNFSNGQWIEPALVHVEASATDHSGTGIDRVEFRAGTLGPSTDTSAPYASTGFWLINEGNVELRAEAFDGCGRSSVASVTVHVNENATICELDTGPPSVAVASPVGTITQGTVEVVADVSDDTALQAGFLIVDGVLQTPGVVSSVPANYRFPWDATVGTHSLQVRALDVCGKFATSAPRIVTVETHPSCTPGAGRLCLQGGRFQVTLPGASAVPFSDTSGGFHFGQTANLEVIAKVIDAGSAFWVFHGALTDSTYTLTVTDLSTGTSRNYSGGGPGLCGGGDVGSFPAGLAPVPLGAAPLATLEPTRFATLEAVAPTTSTPPSAAGSCVPSSTVACLQGGRFAVRVIGGQAAPYSDLTATFWLFQPSNVEIGVKIIDGSSVNGHWWLFYGGATDTDYQIRVTDTVTGTTRTYAGGNFCGGGDVEAF